MTRANAFANRGGRPAERKVSRRKGLLRSAFARYELLKSSWVAANPEASPAAYEAAMRHLSRLTSV